jgi:hypothetical protein
MRHPRPACFLLIPVLALALVPVLHGEDKDLTGTFMFGYRAVDTGGAYQRYQQDFNLEKGVRLFNFELTYLAPDILKAYIDRVDLAVTNFGGDPFETFSLSLQKYGVYRFRYERKKSTYFYDDLRQVGPSLYDPHLFNFDRVSDSGSFLVTLAKVLNVYFDFNRYTKSGDSGTTLDINQSLFDLTKPVSEKLTEFAGGIDFHSRRYSLLFEERYQEYKTTNSLYLPGPSAGGASAASALTAFELLQPYHFKTFIETFRFTARPFDSLMIRGSGRIGQQDTTLSATLDASGMDSSGNVFSDNQSGAGSFTRTYQMYDLDANYLFFNRLAVIGAVRYNKFSQDGSLSLTSGAGSDSTEVNFHTLGLEAGLQYQVTSKFGLTVGYRNETRTLTPSSGLTDEEGLADFKTVRHGLFGTAKWDLKNLKFTADYQHGTYDDAYTLISPTQFDRVRVTARYEAKGFSVAANLLTAKSKNVLPGGANFRIIFTDDNYSDIWTGTNTQFSLRLGYRAPKWNASLGYNYIDLKQTSDRQIAYNPDFAGPAGTFPWLIRYEGRSNVFDASCAWTLTERWDIGGYANTSKTTGFWPIERTMVKAYLKHTFLAGFVGEVGYRYVNFKESSSGFNNYSASIFEFSFGYRWD